MTRFPRSPQPNTLRGSAVAKWEYVRDQIADAVKRGEFRPGERLPSERDLALRFNVSYMTARRAVTALVEADILHRRERSGTYVAGSDDETVATRLTVNVICTAYETPAVDEFVDGTARTIDERGWDMNLIRVSEDNQGPAAAAIRDAPASFVLLHDLYPWQQVRAALIECRDKVVISGSRTDHLGVRCVQSDDAYAMRLAVNHLQEMGHANIAYLLHEFEQPSAQLRVAVWRSCFTDTDNDTLNARLVKFSVEPFQHQGEKAYEALKAYLTSPDCDASAVVCQNNEVAVGALAACRDVGMPVPEKFSLISLGETAIARLCDPPLTCIDYDRLAETRAALDMLGDSLAGRLPDWDRLRLTTPRLSERGTVAPRAST